jgi:hypothetical protein
LQVVLLVPHTERTNVSNDKKNQSEQPKQEGLTIGKEELGELVMTAVAAAAQVGRQPSESQLEALKNKVAAMQGCPECGQTMFGCKGQHVQMVVWPDNPHHAQFFQGVFINGVKYCSPGPGVPITVPAKNDIRSMLSANAELEESYLRTKKHGGNLGTPGAVNRRVI